MFATTLFFVSLVMICQRVQATIYVTSPLQSTTCHGGQQCTVQWLDNGEAPNLSDIGPCHIALYNGQEVLVQQIPPVDVGAEHSLVFTPDPHAGPDSGTYYINFTSVNPVGAPPRIYSQFSTFFKLADMAGSLDTPVPSDTSSLLIPSNLASGTTNGILTTLTIHTPSPSSTPSSTPPSDSHTLSLSFSAASSLPLSPSGTVNPSTTGTSNSHSTSSAGSSTPSGTPTPSSTASATTQTVTPSSTSGGGTTLTVPPPSSGFTTSRAPSLSLPALNPTSSPSSVSAGTLDGKPSLSALTLFSVFSATILFGCGSF